MLTAKKKCPGTDRIARDMAVRRSDCRTYRIFSTAAKPSAEDTE